MIRENVEHENTKCVMLRDIGFIFKSFSFQSSYLIILELFIFIPIFPPSSHSQDVFFFPVGLSALTTNRLQETKTTCERDDGGKISNKNK